MSKPKKAYCQSCGMPLARDAQGGGTNLDGSKTQEYCSHCYQQGQFTEPDLTVDQMIIKVKGLLKTMHIPGFLSGYFTKDIPALKRWQSRFKRIFFTLFPEKLGIFKPGTQYPFVTCNDLCAIIDG